MYSTVNFRQKLFLLFLFLSVGAEGAEGHATAGTEILYIDVAKTGCGPPFVTTGQLKGCVDKMPPDMLPMLPSTAAHGNAIRCNILNKPPPPDCFAKVDAPSAALAADALMMPATLALAGVPEDFALFEGWDFSLVLASGLESAFAGLGDLA